MSLLADDLGFLLADDEGNLLADDVPEPAAPAASGRQRPKAPTLRQLREEELSTRAEIDKLLADMKARQEEGRDDLAILLLLC